MYDGAVKGKKKFQHFFSVPILTQSVLIKLISNNSDTNGTQWRALFTLFVLI